MNNKKGFYEKYLKRLMDIVLSLSAIIVLAPVFLLVAVLVRKKLGKPVIFSQERPGLHEKIFKLYKFRSMMSPRDKYGNEISEKQRLYLVKQGKYNEGIITDEQRLTSFGKLLRSTSLDELPELINILKGDMSFIGPRPLSTLYLPFYNDIEKHRHDVRPGLTGLAQINGRNAITWEKRFAYDIEYINSISFIDDLKIFLKTFWVVFKRSDICQGHEEPIAFHILRKAELEKGC